MERNQEHMQFLSLFGIYKEAYKIIFSHKIFLNKITIYLILPLSFLLLAEVNLSNTLFAIKIIINNNVNEHHILTNTPTCNKLSDSFFSDMTSSWLFKIGYYTSILVFSSLSTAAVVYTTTCAYIGQDVTFKKVKNVVFKVWKRVMVNSLCSYMFLLTYINILQLVLEWVRFFPHNFCFRAFGCKVRLVSYTHYETHHWSNQIQSWIRFLCYISFISVWRLLFVIGLVYISIIWQMASVISVLEEGSVIKAIIKSKKLIKGKIWISTTIFLTMSMFVMFIRGEYGKLFLHGSLINMVIEVPFGILCFWFLCQLVLFGLTVQTVTYFVCKSYHHEIVQLHPHDT